MSDFYTPPADIPAVSRAKAIQINELKDSVEAGFDAVEAALDGYVDTITTAETNAGNSASAAAESANEASGSADEAAGSADESAQSALDANNYAAAMMSTSTTSLLIEEDSKTFTTQAGKNFTAGQFVSAVSAADHTNYMHGTVTSYSGTTLIVDVTDIGGAGTFADWALSISGSRGPQGEVGPANIPSGIIVMWSGSIATTPSGWYLCDGSNGTPDLTDRFVIGAGDSYSVDDTGGSADAVVVSHNHGDNFSIVSAGAHTHTITGGSSTANDGVRSGDTTSLGTATTDSAGSHSHTLNGGIFSTGVSGTDANLPPYYALAYIMKA